MSGKFGDVFAQSNVLQSSKAPRPRIANGRIPKPNFTSNLIAVLHARTFCPTELHHLHFSAFHDR
jgi:hypothetical protein